jgi:hypothetical protein
MVEDIRTLEGDLWGLSRILTANRRRKVHPEEHEQNYRFRKVHEVFEKAQEYSICGWSDVCLKVCFGLESQGCTECIL